MIDNKCTIFTFLIFIFFINHSPVNGQSKDDKTQEIQEYVKTLFSETEPGVVILAARDGKPIFRKGFGLADIENRIILNPNHSFAIGSVSKQFTAMAVVILAEQGMLSLNDNIIKYFPHVKKFKGVKIHHLLTHTSGIKDLFKIEKWSNDLSEALNQLQTFNMIISEDLEFNPGEKTVYSNSGYYLLGMIVEKIIGKSLNQFIRKNIFEEVGMSETAFIDDLNPSIPTAKGYEKRAGNIVKPFKVSKTRFYAGGAVITTVDDLLKWDEALYTEKIFNKSIQNLYFEPYILNDGEESNNACGWEINHFGKLKIFGHGGGINGYVCQVYRVPEEHLYVAVLSNILDHNAKYSVASIAQRIVSIVLEDKVTSDPEKSVWLSEADLKKYKGDYRLPDGSVRKIIVQNGKVFYQFNETKKIEIFPKSKTVFRGGKASTIKFFFYQNGDVERFEIHTGRGRAVIGLKEN